MKDNSRKCAKCKATTAQDSELILHRFPKPGPSNMKRLVAWARYCYPDEDWSSEEFQKKLYVSHKMLCSKHFPSSAFVKDHLQRDKLHRYAVPSELTTITVPAETSSPQPSTSKACDTLIHTTQAAAVESDILEIEQHRTAEASVTTDKVLLHSKHPKLSDKPDMEPIIIVHGGAGDIPQSRVQGKLDGVKLAVIAGHKILTQGGTALDAVEAAEYFNAGYGSVLNLRGEVEMEASIMCGKNLNVGAVTLVKDFLHPISIAHKVLTDSPHSLLGGEGAKIFALEKGFQTVPPESLISENAKHALDNFLQHGEFGRTEIGIIDEGGVGTVGAVAVDSLGHVAVATSTGGMSGKAVGRIGDTPQIGSGTYADDNVGGVSTTGHGESILKYCLAHSIIKLMDNGTDASTATKTAVNGMTERLKNTAGAITLSKNGNVGVHFSSNRMAWAYIKSNKMCYGIEQNEIHEEQYIEV